MPSKRCLVLHDGEDGLSDAVQTGELLRHFKTSVELKALSEYAPGDADAYAAVFYVGTSAGAEVPADLLHDLSTSEASFCWLICRRPTWTESCVPP